MELPELKIAQFDTTGIGPVGSIVHSCSMRLNPGQSRNSRQNRRFRELEG
jgi:hypothetical protein